MKNSGLTKKIRAARKKNGCRMLRRLLAGSYAMLLILAPVTVLVLADPAPLPVHAEAEYAWVLVGEEEFRPRNYCLEDGPLVTELNVATLTGIPEVIHAGEVVHLNLTLDINRGNNLPYTYESAAVAFAKVNDFARKYYGGQYFGISSDGVCFDDGSGKTDFHVSSGSGVDSLIINLTREILSPEDYAERDGEYQEGDQYAIMLCTDLGGDYWWFYEWQDVSGEISGEISGVASGEESGEISGEESGEISGEDGTEQPEEPQEEIEEDDEDWGDLLKELFDDDSFDEGTDGMDGGWKELGEVALISLLFLLPFAQEPGGPYPGRGGYNLERIPGGGHLSYDEDGDLVGRDPNTGKRTVFVDLGNGKYRSTATGWEANPWEIAESYDTRARNAGYWQSVDREREAGAQMVREDTEGAMRQRIMEERAKEEAEKRRREAEREQQLYVEHQIRWQGGTDKKDTLNKMGERQKHLEKSQANWQKIADRSDKIYKTTAIVKTVSDSAVDVLGEYTGPLGKGIKTGYGVVSEIAGSVGTAYSQLDKGADWKDVGKAVFQGTVQGSLKGGINVLGGKLTGEDGVTWVRKTIVNATAEGGKRIVDAYGDPEKSYLGEFGKGAVTGAFGTLIDMGLEKGLSHELSEYAKLGYSNEAFVKNLTIIYNTGGGSIKNAELTRFGNLLDGGEGFFD